MIFNTTKDLNQFISRVQDVQSNCVAVDFTIQSIDDYGTVENMLESVSHTLGQCFFKMEFFGQDSSQYEQMKGDFLRNWYNPFKYNKTMKFIKKNDIKSGSDPKLVNYIKTLLSVNIKSDKGFG